MPSLLLAAAFCGAAFLLTGCFHSVPVEPSTVSPGEEVVVHLDSEGTQRVTREEGYAVRTLRGVVEGAEAGSLRLSARVTGGGSNVPASARRVHQVPFAEIAMMERRELDTRRTALVGLGAAGALVLAVLAARTSGSADDGPLDPGQPHPVVIPR